MELNDCVGVLPDVGVGADVGDDAVVAADGVSASTNASTSGTSVVRTRSSSKLIAVIVLCSVGGSFTLSCGLAGGAGVDADGSE